MWSYLSKFWRIANTKMKYSVFFSVSLGLYVGEEFIHRYARPLSLLRHFASCDLQMEFLIQTTQIESIQLCSECCRVLRVSGTFPNVPAALSALELQTACSYSQAGFAWLEIV